MVVPSCQGVRGLAETMLSPSRALIGKKVTSVKPRGLAKTAKSCRMFSKTFAS